MPEVCEYCGRPIEGMPFVCNYCGGTFCAEHHMPPNHNCPNLWAWRAKPPPGVTMSYAPRARRIHYAGVDVPASERPYERISTGPVPRAVANEGAVREFEVPVRVVREERGAEEHVGEGFGLLVVIIAIFLLLLFVLGLATWNPLLMLTALALTASMALGYYLGSKT